MANANVSERGSSPTAGDLNDLFDYDIGLDEIIPDNNAPNTNNTKASGTGDSALGLGLDEEVKVAKKRQPVAKLDEGRLLSQPGIPKLRHTARQKLKFKGKGHEFKDAARLLNFYQLWLDDLFPRAKFADGLTMIEKLGHSKRIQSMRREWIDEEKPRLFDSSGPTREDLENRDPKNPADFNHNPAAITQDQEGAADQDLFIPDPNESARPTISYPEPEDDDLDDLLREQDEPMADFPPDMHASSSRVPDDDNDDYDAEYEAMKELGM
ncbi:Replication fork protection component Swi3 [Penicillium camemberti]|uniref:Chromosome segregation in meiosis protein n=1 Tax=Penicillium camemberti (strain FM 013) TaxID=1429867 RepID=A0A0G4PCG2_PENC3|nr:Replication fork protection component Swi3 [Penicillium camemberti]